MVAIAPVGGGRLDRWNNAATGSVNIVTGLGNQRLGFGACLSDIFEPLSVFHVRFVILGLGRLEPGILEHQCMYHSVVMITSVISPFVLCCAPLNYSFHEHQLVVPPLAQRLSSPPHSWRYAEEFYTSLIILRIIRYHLLEHDGPQSGQRLENYNPAFFHLLEMCRTCAH